MRNEYLINKLMEITNKFKEYQADPKTNPFYYEVLHASLTEVLRIYPKETWEKAPLTVKRVVDILNSKILESTSYEYKKIFEKQQENEKSIATDKTNGKNKKRCCIGFSLGDDDQIESDDEPDLSKK